MLKKLKNIFVVLAGSAMLLSPALVPAVANAATTDVTNNINGALNCGSNLDVNSQSCQTDNGSGTSINTLLTNIINVFSVIVGVVAVVMIVFGGLRYIISGGDSGNTATARNTIFSALVGLIIVALAQVVVHFVLAKLGPS